MPVSEAAWFTDLRTDERRALLACTGGWVLDAMDVQMYSFVLPSIMALWHVSSARAGLLGTATLLASALGGWLAGALADRIGRVRTLQITILWFAAFCAICAVAQSFNQLFAARAIMGFGFGGEWAAGSVLLGEVIRPHWRGRAVGTMQSGWAVGWAIAALLYTGAFSLLPAAIAWRVLFAFGLAPALLVFFLRRFVEEPAVFRAAQARIADGGKRARMRDIFAPDLLRTTLLCALMGTGAQGGYYAITTWLPSFLRGERHLSVLNTGLYLAVLIAGSFAGYLAGAELADRLGRRPTFLLYAVGSFVTVLLYTLLPLGDGAMLLLGAPLGFVASGGFSAMGPFFTELFPTRVRGMGQGFAYNFGRGTGALFPFLVGWLAGRLSLGAAIGLFAAGAYAVMAIAALLLPETRGRALAPD